MRSTNMVVPSLRPARVVALIEAARRQRIAGAVEEVSFGLDRDVAREVVFAVSVGPLRWLLSRLAVEVVVGDVARVVGAQLQRLRDAIAPDTNQPRESIGAVGAADGVTTSWRASGAIRR